MPTTPHSQPTRHRVARNVFNEQEVSEWVRESAASLTQEPTIRNNKAQLWAQTVARRHAIRSLPAHLLTTLPDSAPAWAKKVLALGEPLHQAVITATERSTFRHIMDWLTSEQGPKLNVDWSRMSYSAATIHSNLWTARLNAAAQKRDKKVELVVSGAEEVNREFASGLILIALKNRAALAQEGESMHNCISDKAGDVANGNLHIFSFRTPAGKPLANLSVSREGRVEEVKGNCNTPIPSACVNEVVEIIRENGWTLSYDARNDLLCSGVVPDENGTLIPLGKLPHDFVIQGDLLVPADFNGPWPSELQVSGTLTFPDRYSGPWPAATSCSKLIFRCLRHDFPGHVTCIDCDLSLTPVQRLPNDLQTQTLNVSRSDIREIPSHLTLRHLDLSFCQLDTPLPTNAEEINAYESTWVGSEAENAILGRAIAPPPVSFSTAEAMFESNRKSGSVSSLADVIDVLGRMEYHGDERSTLQGMMRGVSFNPTFSPMWTGRVLHFAGAIRIPPDILGGYREMVDSMIRSHPMETRHYWEGWEAKIPDLPSPPDWAYQIAPLKRTQLEVRYGRLIMPRSALAVGCGCAFLAQIFALRAGNPLPREVLEQLVNQNGLKMLANGDKLTSKWKYEALPAVARRALDWVENLATIPQWGPTEIVEVLAREKPDLIADFFPDGAQSATEELRQELLTALKPTTPLPPPNGSNPEQQWITATRELLLQNTPETADSQETTGDAAWEGIDLVERLDYAREMVLHKRASGLKAKQLFLSAVTQAAAKAENMDEFHSMMTTQMQSSIDWLLLSTPSLFPDTLIETAKRMCGQDSKIRDESLESMGVNTASETRSKLLARLTNASHKNRFSTKAKKCLSSLFATSGFFTQQHRDIFISNISCMQDQIVEEESPAKTFSRAERRAKMFGA